MSKPLISVILTAYNDAEYLPKSINALLHQTLQNIEIIAIDDASTDTSKEVMEKFAKTDSRIKLIYNNENSGLSVARNRGIEAASAGLIMFCDADDYYEDTMCEQMYEAMTDTDVDLATCEINVIYHAHHEMKSSDDAYYALKYTGLQKITDSLILNTDASVANKIFRRSLLDQYSLQFPAGLRFEDAFFCTAYLMLSKKIFFVNKRLYNYVRHNNSIMSQTWSTQSNVDKAIDHTTIAIKLYDFLQQNHLLDDHIELYWQLFESFLSFSIVNSKTQQSRNAVRKLAQSFINEHRTDFERAQIEQRERIKRLYSRKHQLNVVGIKKTLIKIMPTYKLQADNIRQLHALKQRCARLKANLKETK